VFIESDRVHPDDSVSLDGIQRARSIAENIEVAI
jgi:hypothetical protein